MRNEINNLRTEINELRALHGLDPIPMRTVRQAIQAVRSAADDMLDDT